jgi:molecular chaperone GrpE
MPSKRKTDDQEAAARAQGEGKPESGEGTPPETPSAAGGEAGQSVQVGDTSAESDAATPAAAGETAPGIEELSSQVQELSSQLEEANASRLRLAADFDNFKKRARQEQLETMKFAAATVAEKLLGVLDNADLALAQVPEGTDETWLKGIKLIFQRLEEVLNEVGVQRIESVGVRFDPKLHEAIGSEPSGEYPEDTVVVELRPGYRMHERVLRPALVKVARPPA